MAVKVDNNVVNGYDSEAERAFLMTPDESLDKIAKSLVVSIMEDQIYRLFICAEDVEVVSFKDAENKLNTNKMVELAIEMMKDHIGYFEKRLEAAIRRRIVEVESIKMTKNGIEDVDVNVM